MRILYDLIVGMVVRSETAAEGKKQPRQSVNQSNAAWNAVRVWSTPPSPGAMHTALAAWTTDWPLAQSWTLLSLACMHACMQMLSLQAHNLMLLLCLWLYVSVTAYSRAAAQFMLVRMSVACMSAVTVTVTVHAAGISHAKHTVTP